jgi:hypothetical protein
MTEWPAVRAGTPMRASKRRNKVIAPYGPLGGDLGEMPGDFGE